MKTIERRVSFNGGEFSPWTDPRIDMEKYRTGCRRLENFRPAIYGGAFSRAGTVFVGEQLNGGSKARLVPFEFSATTNLVLEFTDLNLRVWTSGAVPGIPQVGTGDLDPVEDVWSNVPPVHYERGRFIRYTLGVGPPVGIYYCVESHTTTTFAADLADGKWRAQTALQLATPYAAAELDELQFAQQNDLVFITHPNHPPLVLSRFSDSRWTLKPLVQEWPALRDENIAGTTLWVPGTPDIYTKAIGEIGGTVTVNASKAVFQSGHKDTRWVMRHRRPKPFVTLGLDGVAVDVASAPLFVLGDWSLTVISGSGTGAWETVAVVERSYTGVKMGLWETVRTLPSSRADRSGIITGTEIDPCWLRVRMVETSGDAAALPDHGKYTLEAVDPDHYGIVEITGVTNATSAQAKVVFPIWGDAATKYWSEPAWSDYRGWPRSVCIHETRLFFGGNAAQPQTLWGSAIDDYYNFRLGSNDDMALAFTLAQRADSIQWLLSQEALLVGTAGAEGPVGSREGDKALSPANAKAGRFSQTGSAFIQAVAVQDAVVFINRSRRKAWEFAFSFEADGFKANDLTLLAEHVADGGIRQIAVQRKPDPVLWAVDASGQLLGVAYERSQRVAGWFRYVTEGTIESVAALGGDGEEDQVWITVQRAGGRFIERFQPERGRLLKEGDQAHLCCADAAIIYDGAPATVIGGLSHLEGQEVCVLADGAPVSNRTVAGGGIVLDAPAAVVVAGLPFACYLQPTFMETNDPASVSKVAWKNIHRVTLELWKSLGCSVSCNGGETWERVEFLQQGDAMDEALPLFTGVRELLVEGRSERQVSPILRQDQPLPLNVQSLHVWHEMNGG